MPIRKTLAVALLAAGGFVNAHAAALAGNGSWSEFDVDSLLSGGLAWIDLGGAPLSFDFTINTGEQGVLTVVDAGFVGDTFNVFNGASLLGATSSVPVHTYSASETAIANFDAAIVDPSFSRAAFTLGAGTYSINGVLTQSVQDSFGPLNATLGGVRLQVSPVPEPAAIALLLAGIGLISAGARRRSR